MSRSETIYISVTAKDLRMDEPFCSMGTRISEREWKLIRSILMGSWSRAGDEEEEES